MSNKSTFTSVILFSVIIAVAIAGYLFSQQERSRSVEAAEIEGFLWPNPKSLQAFDLVDHTGQNFKLEGLHNKWSLLFFGYTHCPDVCPTTLQTINAMHDSVLTEKQKVGLQTIFVSVDSERDTQKQLSHYITLFNENFIALGGTQQQIESLTKQVGVAHFRSDEQGVDYLVDHTASVFLIDPQGRFVGIFRAPQQAQDMATRFVKIRQFIEGS